MIARKKRRERRKQFRQSLTAITALLVLLIAVFAAGALWILQRLYGDYAGTEAGKQFFQMGGEITELLAFEYDTNSLQVLSRQVGALHSIEEGLQYVTVTLNGEFEFVQQTQGIHIGAPESADPFALQVDVEVRKEMIELGEKTIPVYAFTKRFVGDDGAERELKVAMKFETIAREKRTATEAIRSMFSLSLIAVVISFGVCALLVVWMMRRESNREKQRREEEHLIFAGVMANGIVHDFRNPMSSMRLDVQMLNKEVAKGAECRPGRVSALAGRVEHTVERMDKVFQEFLFMSKPPSDEREEIDLASSVRECAYLVAPRSENANIHVDLDIPSQPVAVLAYPSGLQRALMNVILNAEQASSDGDHIRVRVLKGERAATVDVIDSGPGIPVADRQRIFEMFVTGKPGGTGLGLFLARTAIERCGGSLKVVDTSKGGSCFRFTVPLADSRP